MDDAIWLLSGSFNTLLFIGWKNWIHSSESLATLLMLAEWTTSEEKSGIKKRVVGAQMTMIQVSHQIFP